MHLSQNIFFLAHIEDKVNFRSLEILSRINTNHWKQGDLHRSRAPQYQFIHIRYNSVRKLSLLQIHFHLQRNAVELVYFDPESQLESVAGCKVVQLDPHWNLGES